MHCASPPPPNASVRRAALLLLSSIALGCNAESNAKGNEGAILNPVDASPDAAAAEETAPPFDSGTPVVFDVEPPPNDAPFEPETACATAAAPATRRPVDIVVVIDQSGSMDAESVQVRDNVNKLSGYLAATGLDYRLVMIAGHSSGSLKMCVPPPLANPSCASKPPRFRAVDQHVESWDALKLVLKTYDSTDPATKWSDVLRPDAVKVFIPITDDNPDDDFIDSPVAENFDKELLARGRGTFGTKSNRKYVFYPICGVSKTSTTTKCATAVNTGEILVELATLTKGKPFSVCETNYEPVFKEIGKAIASTVACEISIPPAPDGETFDPAKVNVTFTDGAGTASTVYQDATRDCFVDANGWQYSPDGSQIILCGEACTKAKAEPSARIDVEFGCETKVKPPT